jgi:transcriptional regulator with XRE-family HTH domain
MPEEIPRSLSFRLRRIAAGLRQVDVAHLCGISATHLSLIERGEAQPTALELKLLERALPQLPSMLPK